MLLFGLKNPWQFKFRENTVRSNFQKWQRDLKGQDEWAGPAEGGTDMIWKSDVTNWTAQAPDADCRKALLGSYSVFKMLVVVCQVIWSPPPYGLLLAASSLTLPAWPW